MLYSMQKTWMNISNEKFKKIYITIDQVNINIWLIVFDYHYALIVGNERGLFKDKSLLVLRCRKQDYKRNVYVTR